MQPDLSILLLLAVLWLIAGILWLPARPILKFVSILTVLAVAVRLPLYSAGATTEPEHAFLATHLRTFLLIGSSELLCLALLLLWLVRRRHTDVLAPLVSVIFGLDFLLLAPLLNVPLYFGTGSAIVLAGLLCTQAAPPLRGSCVCLSTGALLWSTVLLLLQEHTHVRA